MPVLLKKNPYSGLNAHHLSFLQHHKLWEGFHLSYIAKIRETLRLKLPPNYVLNPELSLQLVELPPQKPVRTRGDVVISQMSSTPATFLPAVALATPTREFSLEEVLSPDEYLGALVIYQPDPDRPLGKPITRIEVLSPANKPPQSYHYAYWEKRRQSLAAGINLVELDFLHETANLLTEVRELDLPNYAAGEPDALPYHIIISNPHPTLREGRMALYSFGVADPVPLVPIPLADEDQLAFDFGIPYHHVFEIDDYAHWLIDYEQTPLNFETYNPTDQERLRQRMAAIQQGS